MTIDLPGLSARIGDLLTAYAIPSAAIGVLREGELTEFAVGVKNVVTGEPATADTVYQCGSMTKTWTALAFLQLVDEGAVDLDTPVRTYLPGFAVADPEVSATVTPRHLLQHTNGIEEAYGDPGEDDDVYERMVDAIADAPQVFPLGHTHGYSAALGYAVLARILEVHDGKRWDDVMRDRVFGPLGLTGTGSRREQVDESRAATGHLTVSLTEDPIVTPVDYLPRAFGPGGNVTSTVREVLAMAHVILTEGLAPTGKRILSAERVREMKESRVPVPDPYMFGPEWALGLIVCDWHGQTVYASDGSTIGQNSRLRILPEADTAIVLLTNGGPRESFYRKAFTEILADLGLPGVPDLPAPDPALILDPTRYAGVYERPGARFEVTAEDGRLHLTLGIDPMQAEFLGKPDRVTYELLAVSETHFLMPPTDELEDTQTVAIYDFASGTGRAQYLHTNCRVHPRVE
ncbi:CubicO group peptidase (beta-lactamase class C family) [Hamadaea flava]|uniref:Serine hydrolase n=1 Tax=Hamadaea flava TaxID=1742688 RepID=A0ABV8LPV1_9ACTN|nr:serine hydrolase [Hamadaea flava]MCP2323036.1 CubicO group peptidase (beta-lactamase class C family) [Hamadaea flava]